MKKDKFKKAGRPRFEDLSPTEQRQILESFARKLEESLDENKPQNLGRRDVMEAVKNDCDFKLDARFFDKLMLRLYKEGYLRFGHRTLLDLAHKLREKPGFKELDDVTVVAGSDSYRFAQAGAEEFVKCIFDTAVNKNRPSDEWLNIGVFSGTTTGAVVHIATAMNWKESFNLNASDLGKVRVVALNIHLTGPEYIGGNASILAYELTAKINKEAGKDDVAQAYGLWGAPLLLEERELGKVDNEPQNIEVLRYTEPYRVHKKLLENRSITKEPEETNTELDIVLTGVGELPQKGEFEGSIFYNLATNLGVNMIELVEKERIVGDIAFTAITSTGAPIPLRKGEEDFVFYAAVRPPILESMVQKKNKSVILVAQNFEKEGRKKDKVPAIHASVAGQNHRYVSRLITDEQTCHHLLYY